MNYKFLVLFFFSFIMANAQNSGSISGKVTDKNNNSPISYATIVIKSDSKIVTGGITDDNGNFDIKNLELVPYVIEIQYIGYKTSVIEATLSADKKSVTLPKISLEEEYTQLEDVTIVAERSTIEQKIDRKVINVGKDLTTAGATASDIMGNIPTVNVDQNGNISLRGNENVRVLVDGRPTNIDAAQLLKQIPSTSIKKIELITNPSAKYNPEGMSGIINIVLHKNSNNGFNASVNTGVTFANTPKINNSVDMNYREGKVNFFGTYGNNIGYQFGEGEVNRLDENSHQRFNNINDNKSHLFKIGMDFYIDDHNTISAYTNQNFFKGKGESHSSNLFPDSSDDFFSEDYNTNWNKTGTYNLAYKHLFTKEGHTLDFETNYSKTTTDQDVYYYPSGNTPLTAYIDLKDQNRSNTNINLDYVNPLNSKSTLELGAEARLIRTDNTFETTGLLLEDAAYIYDQNIFSAYATFGQKFKKISYQVGARFESYKVDAILNGASAYKDDYFTVYPSAYLTYSLNDKNTFQLSYSRRVDRPSLEQSSPLPEFSTQRLISIGNPELDPQFTNSMELNYTKSFEKGTFTTGVFYRIINDEINRILLPNPENPNNQIMKFDNFDNNTAFGFEASANYKIKSWWDIQPAIDFSSINQQGFTTAESPTTPGSYIQVSKKITANAFNARMNSNFKATKRLSFLLFGFYRGNVDGIQFDRKSMYKIDTGARYSLWQNKASLSVRVNDIFETMRFGFDGNNPFPQQGEFRWESQSVFVNFNYRFGAGKNRALQRKQREDNTKQNSGGMF